MASFIKTCVISGLQQLFEHGYFHADPHPGNMFALKGGSKDSGHLAYVDFGMMDNITNSDRLTLIKAIVHIINEQYLLLAKDFQKLGFLTKEQDLNKIVEPLKEVLGGSSPIAGRGIQFGAGANPRQEIQYFSLVTMGDALNFGDLASGRSSTTSVSSATKGYCCGGYIDRKGV